MKKIIYLLLLVVLISGCNSKVKKNLPIKYQNISYNYESIGENKTRVYTIIQNTSKNDGKIYNVGYAVRTKDGVLQKGNVLNKSYNIKKDEEVVIIFDVDYDINNISSVIVTPFDENNKPIEYYQSNNKIKYNDLSDSIDIVSMKTNKKMSVKFSLEKQISSKMIKLVVYSKDDKPVCISYNYQNKILKDKEYIFKCEDKIDLENVKISAYYK